MFTKITSKENMENRFQLKLCNALYIIARSSSQGFCKCSSFFLKLEDVESFLEVDVARKT